MEIRKSDRRQENIPVDTDRRSGVDRREQEKQGHSSVFYALETVPTFRRTLSISDNLESGNTATAIGLAGLAAINLPEDIRDVKGALKQLKGAATNYDHYNYQHNFSFFKGTAIEEWLCKHFDMGKKWAIWLRKNDKTLADTSLGKNITKFLKTDVSDIIESSITNFKGEQAVAVKYNGSAFAQLTGRVLRRTTKLGTLTLALLETPKIFKSDKKIKQTTKSFLNIASITAGIGYGGAIGFKYGGSTGSLMGMGIGAVLGSKTSDKLQEAI